MTETLDIKLSHIRVEERFRREYGDIEALAESIYARGLLQPIGIDPNYRLVFGERRLKAFEHLERDTIPARIVHVDSILLAEHDENELRKDFTTSERVAIGQAIEREMGSRQGQRTELQENFPEVKGRQTRDIAAEKAGFGNARTYQQAKSVVQFGDESLVDAMDAGKVSVSAAADVATLPKEEQSEVVARGEKEILEAAKQIRVKKAEARRAANERLKAEAPPLPDGKYECIVIDPPWPMQKIERDVSPNQVAFDYPTMQEEEIKAVELPMADDCHVWIWTTHKFLPMALRCAEHWGLKYICTFVWHKPGGFQPFGLPQYNCEFALYCRKGAPTFAETKAFKVAFEAPRGAHSEKPKEFYEMVARVTAGRRLDMFNRRPIDGFDVWGNESARMAS